MNSKKIVPNDLVPIGNILKAHGLFGEVKAFLYNIDSDSLKPEFEGCKSWVELNLNQTSGQSVLTDLEIETELKKFREIVN